MARRPQIVTNAPLSQRVARRPKHDFQVRHRPFVIQPFCIAPVLPGETMENALLQSRCVTAPIKNPLVGWWLDHMLFYVKHRDLDARDLLVDMHLTPGTDVSSLYTAAKTDTYHYAASIDWVDLCLKRVTEEYFRDEGEAWDAFTIDGMPVAGINADSYLDSIMDETIVPEGSDPQTTADNMETLDRYRQQYDLMRQMKMIGGTFEDYLKTFGVRGVDVQEPHKPELLRHSRDWQYPSNTVDPATGVPSSAVSWVIGERADKERFFKEPGFIFGVTVARPKVYLSRLKGAGVHMLDDAWSWLPALMAEDPASSLKLYTAAGGPLETPTNGFWLDLKDLFVYGDQFVNVAFDGTLSDIALPDVALNTKYPTEAMVDGLFVGANPQTVKQDGVVHFTILGRQVDLT